MQPPEEHELIAFAHFLPTRHLTVFVSVISFSLLLVFVLPGYSPPARAEMQTLSPHEMAEVSGREGISFDIDWRIDAENASLQIREREYSYTDSLTLTGLSVVPPGGGAGTLQFGTMNDPFVVNVEGSQGGFLNVRFPESESNLPQHDVVFHGLEANGTPVLNEIRLADARYAGGTYLSLGGYDRSDPPSGSQGGLKIGLAIRYDGDINIEGNDSDGLSSGLSINGDNWAGLNGFNFAADCPGSCSFDDPSTWSGFDNAGPLTFADIPAGRPFVVNFFTDGDGDPKLHLELNPETVVATAGDLAIAKLELGNKDYGETFANNLSIGNLSVRGPQDFSTTGSTTVGEGNYGR